MTRKKEIKSKKIEDATTTPPTPVSVMVSSASTVTEIKDNLIRSMRAVLNPNADRSQLPVLRKLMIRRIQSSDANLLINYPDSPDKTLLDVLKTYCEQNPLNDELPQILNEWTAIKHFTNHIKELLLRRSSDLSSMNVVKLYKNSSPTEQSYNDTLFLSFSSKSIGQAQLIATMIEKVMNEHYGIPYRSIDFNLPITFIKTANGEVTFKMYYKNNDYLQCFDHQKSTAISDSTMETCFLNRNSELSDYCMAMLKKSNPKDFETSEPSKPHRNKHRFHQPPQMLVQKRPLRLLIFTVTRAGFGNYINAARVIQRLVESIPMNIDWVIEDGGQVFPPISLPESVRIHRANTFWKIAL